MKKQEKLVRLMTELGVSVRIVYSTKVRRSVATLEPVLITLPPKTKAVRPGHRDNHPAGYG